MLGKDPVGGNQWTPPDDPVFQYLLQEALYGHLPIFFAAVSLPRVRRYAPDFRPERTEEGPAVVQQIINRWRKGDTPYCWVYPKGELFILSDDYFTLAAAELGQPDFIPCWVLGHPSPDGAKDIQGPMKQMDMRKMLGMS